VSRVVALWRYPVKSMQGELLGAAEIGPRGIVGDRQWAVVDLETGLGLTARRQPELLYATAAIVGDDVVITLPDGTVATDDDALSRWLGHPVTLTRADASRHGTFEIALDFEHEDTAEWSRWDGPDGTFHDSARTQVSILGTGSVGDWDLRRFRANVIVDGSPEEAWVGGPITLGTAALDVVKQVSRCVITTRPQPGGIERDLDVLRTINRDRDGHLAVGALVTTPGRVEEGDPIGPPP
jgi:uncharacterized protein YcbX